MSKLELHSLLLDEGKRHGLADPTILLGLAQAENGPSGFEMNYGVSDEGEFDPRWRGTQRQAFGAAGLVKELESLFQQQMKQPPVEGDGMYSQEFLAFVSQGSKAFGSEDEDQYEPNRPKKDVTGKAANHFSNLSETYYKLKGRPDLLAMKEE